MKKINFVFDWIGPKGPIPNNLTPSVIDLAKAIGWYHPDPDRNLATGQSSNAYSLLKYRTNQVKTHSTSHLPSEPFVYEYNHYWWESAEEFFGSWKLNGFLGFSNRPTEVFDRIKSNSAFLLVTIPMESPLHDHQLIKIDEYFRNSGLPAKQIIYLTCCPNGKEVYLNFCQRRKLTPLDINFEYLPFYFSVYQDLIRDKTRNYNKSLKEKTFLMFNRRWGNHPQRVLMLCYLYKNNLLDDFYISFSKNEIDNGGIFSEYARRFFNKLNIANTITSEDLLNIENRLPLTLDSDNLKQNLMFDEFDSTENFYNNSMIHLVAETYFFGNIVHITEKSYKPIAYKQPFIMLATAGTLQAIKKQGFRTFESVWDESYDNEKDDTIRFFKVLDLIKSINNKSLEEKQELINACAEIVDFNYNHLKQGANELVIEFVNKYGS